MWNLAPGDVVVKEGFLEELAFRLGPRRKEQEREALGGRQEEEMLQA